MENKCAFRMGAFALGLVPIPHGFNGTTVLKETAPAPSGGSALRPSDMSVLSSRHAASTPAISIRSRYKYQVFPNFLSGNELRC
jgi:hypothetical protein